VRVDWAFQEKPLGDKKKNTRWSLIGITTSHFNDRLLSK
jgi:hypothetical protein